MTDLRACFFAVSVILALIGLGYWKGVEDTTQRHGWVYDHWLTSQFTYNNHRKD